MSSKSTTNSRSRSRTSFLLAYFGVSITSSQLESFVSVPRQSLGMFCRQAILVVRNYRIVHRLAKHVDLGAGKFPRADLALEEQVQFGEGAAAGFGDAEVRIDDAEEADAGPEEAGEVTPGMVSVLDGTEQRMRGEEKTTYQFHAEGLSMYGVSTEQTIPTTM
jgi:hypothetical protein